VEQRKGAAVTAGRAIVARHLGSGDRVLPVLQVAEGGARAERVGDRASAGALEVQGVRAQVHYRAAHLSGLGGGAAGAAPSSRVRSARSMAGMVRLARSARSNLVGLRRCGLPCGFSVGQQPSIGHRAPAEGVRCTCPMGLQSVLACPAPVRFLSFADFPAQQSPLRLPRARTFCLPA